jgi:hypothetical protein
MPRDPQFYKEYNNSRGAPMYEDPIRWHSFSGADLDCIIRIDQLDEVDGDDKNLPAFKKFAELQTVSVSGARSVHPVRRLGQSQPIAYTRGARTIGGSLVFTQFSTDALWDVMRMSTGQETFNAQEPFHTDQLPEFDLIISGTNEYGVSANAIIGGITLTNFGTTMSIHDIYTETTYTYVAKFYMPFAEDITKTDLVKKLLWQARALDAGKRAVKRLLEGANELLDTAQEVVREAFGDLF